MAVAERARGVALLLGFSLGFSLALLPAPSAAEQCQVVDVDFLPADLPGGVMKRPLQIVAWIEDGQGKFVETIFITRQVGTFGLGNRPGRWDFNSGPLWPYGRREGVLPVWAHRYDAARATATPPYNHPPFREVIFQNGDDNNLSHPYNQSSRELHFCRPLISNETAWNMADAGTCASQVFTDKGVFGGGTSLYPPRADVVKTAPDHPSVDEYATINPFDAISGATPRDGAPAMVSWAIPRGFPMGDYVMWIEVSREFDHNGTYSVSAYPAPTGIPWSEYGQPYRGQPSILYKVPFQIGATETVASTGTYAGYGDPTGQDGAVRAPDATITVDVVGSGAQRLGMMSGGYRVRVIARPEFDFAPPAGAMNLQVSSVTSSAATVLFTAPGDDGLVGKVKGYEVRMRADGQPITEANFAESFPITKTLIPAPAGTMQTLDIDGLLFETEYEVAVRAFDDCRNYGPITTLTFRTADRALGEVDACFVATAAYGSVMANDVEMLRRFRDGVLQKTVLGELAVEAYYTFGPAVSGIVGESDLLRATARSFLDPIVDRVRAFKL
ncbi:MAG TPA: fibronectin type III domain-containing protein [Kofleriaceae bacterium]|nr:fibronectin type III domain-containing protein [Kofleriaceae bacterium]